MRLQLHELHHNLGYLLHQQGDFLGAIENYRRALSHCPTYARSHYALGVVLAEQQQYAASIAHYQQAIALHPDYGQAYNNLGCIFLLQGKTDQAIQTFQQGLERQPDLADLQNNLGQVLFDRDREAAIRSFRSAVRLEPTFTLAHRNLGKLFQQYGCHEDALQAFQSALAVDPDQPEVWSDCMVSWLALGQIEEALTGLHWLIQANQPQVDAYCDWALHLSDTDDLTQAHIAAAHFFQAVQHGKAIQSTNSAANPNNQGTTTRSIFSAGATKFLSQAYFYLGSTLVAYGGKPQYKRAEAYLQTAIRLQPQNLQPYLKLADCLMRQKRLNAALLICDAAEITSQASLLPIAPNALQIASCRNLIEQQLTQQQLTQQQLAQQKLSEQQAGQHTEQAANPTNRSAPSLATELEPENKDRLGIAGITAVQDWFDRQVSSGHNPIGGTATHRFISLTDPALPIASESRSLASPLVPVEHSPCEGINCPTCLKRITDAFQPHYLTRSLCRLTGQRCAVSLTPRFTARIPAGKVWAAPQQNSWHACNAIALFSPDRYLLKDLSRSYPIELPCSPRFDSQRHHLFSQTDLPPIEKIKGQVAVLAGLSGHNYFHWMVDVLPRFEILRQSGIDLSQMDWFYLNSPRAAFQQATLKKLGIPLDRVLASDQHPHIQADQLIVPSFTGHFGWLQPWMLEFLRQEFLPLASKRSPIGDRFPERLYISRASANHRRVLNESAVLETLHQHGFVAVELEQFSVADQIALFANAKAIVAPHGGGLTNLMFCNPGTALLEFFSPHYIRHYYWVMSQVLGLTHYCLMSEPIKGHPLRELMYASPLTEDLWIDLDALRTGLEQMGI